MEEKTLDTLDTTQEPQQETTENESQMNPDLASLQDELKALREENKSLKDSLELEHTNSKELATSVDGLKVELKKLKESYAEQFESRSVINKADTESSPKHYDSITSEILDLISK